jgi:hypothetical protein
MKAKIVCMGKQWGINNIKFKLIEAPHQKWDYGFKLLYDSMFFKSFNLVFEYMRWRIYSDFKNSCYEIHKEER